MKERLQKPVNTVRGANAILIAFGIFAGVLVFLGSLSPSDTVAYLAFSLFTIFSGWNSRREALLIFEGLRPGFFYYLTNTLLLILALGLSVVSVLSITRTPTDYSEVFLLIFVPVAGFLFVLFFAPAYSLHLATLAREETQRQQLQNGRSG